MKQLILLVVLLTVYAMPARSGFQPQPGAAAPQNATVPTITFDLNWKDATPQNYTITMDTNGKSQYVSRSPTRTPEGSEEPDPDYHLEFAMSAASRDRILKLAKDLNYFNGDFDFNQHKVANTGRKTLTYTDSARNFRTTYNWSENKAIDQITGIFQGISNTIEHGRKLVFMRRFDKLGLAAELKAMETLSKAHYLAEVQIIAPILQTIADDPSILHLARQSATRLLMVLNP